MPESGHVILCGLNELGYQTLEELRRLGEEVVVVARTPREEFAAGATALGVTLLEGSHRQERVLRSAGPQTANALVVTEDDDVGNVHAALVAHDLNPRLRLRLRMFNQELGNRVQLLFRDCQILDAAAMAVPAFVSAALHRDRQQRLRVGDRSLVVRPASASEPDVLLPLARIHADGDAELFPAPGDELLCLAADDAPTRPTAWVGEARSHRRPSRTSTVASVLDRSNRFLPAMQRLGVPVLARDSRLRDTLQTLQVTTSRSIVVVTSSDTVNLETALSPRALRPDRRVVLRLFDADLAARVERTFGDTAGAGRVIIGG